MKKSITHFFILACKLEMQLHINDFIYRERVYAILVKQKAILQCLCTELLQLAMCLWKNARNIQYKFHQGLKRVLLFSTWTNKKVWSINHSAFICPISYIWNIWVGSFKEQLIKWPPVIMLLNTEFLHRRNSLGKATIHWSSNKINA